MKVTQRSDLAGPIVLADKRRRPLQLIVIHRNTVADNVDGVAAFHRSPPPKEAAAKLRLFPYHFFVDDEDGEVQQVHSVDTVSPHAGPQGFNGIGVAICFNFDARKAAPPAHMTRAAVELIAALILSNGVHAGARGLAVVGHSAEKGCPGKFIDPKALEAEARALLTTSYHVEGDVKQIVQTRRWS